MIRNLNWGSGIRFDNFWLLDLGQLNRRLIVIDQEFFARDLKFLIEVTVQVRIEVFSIKSYFIKTSDC